MDLKFVIVLFLLCALIYGANAIYLLTQGVVDWQKMVVALICLTISFYLAFKRGKSRTEED